MEQLSGIPDGGFWRQKGVFTLEQLHEHGNMRTIEYLSKQHNISHKSFYKYLKLRHALHAQSGKQDLKISNYPPIGITRAEKD